MKYTRKDYMAHKCTHDEYYSQFVDDSILDLVSSYIGRRAITKSTDPHFNNIELSRWDNLHLPILLHCGALLARGNSSGGVSLSDTVCVAKAAARMIKLEATK